MSEIDTANFAPNEYEMVVAALDRASTEAYARARAQAAALAEAQAEKMQYAFEIPGNMQQAAALRQIAYQIREMKDLPTGRTDSPTL